MAPGLTQSYGVFMDRAVLSPLSYRMNTASPTLSLIRRTLRVPVASLLLASFSLWSTQVRGAIVYWDINGTAPGSSGSPVATGTWDAVSAFFNTDPTGGAGGSLSAWNNGDTLVFGAGSNATQPYTVTVAGTQLIGGLTFEEGTLTLSGGTLQLASASSFQVASGLTATVNSTVDGAFNVSKTGNGRLVLGGTNSFSGNTLINAGTLSISSDANLGAVPGSPVADSILFTGSSTLQITGTGNPTIHANRGITLDPGITGTVQVVESANSVAYGGLIAGAAGTTFRKTGLGTLDLQAASGLAGTLLLDGGTLKLSGAGALTGVSGVSLGNRSVLALDNSVSNVGDRTAGPIASAGGTIQFIGNAAATAETLGAVTLNAGALTISTTPGAGGSVLTIPSITRNAGGTLYVTGTGLGGASNQVVLTTANALTNGILPWAVAGNGTVNRFATHGGNGTTLAPQTTGYQAAETAWTANTVNALPTTSQGLTANRTVYSLTLDAGVNLTAAADRSLTIGNGGIGAVLQTGGISTIGQTGTVDNILAFGANEAVFHILGTLQTIRGDSTAGLTGSGGLTKSGPGTLILGGQSTLTGTYRINEGILEARRGDALGATQPLQLNGGMFRLSADGNTSFTSTITVNADATIQVDRITAAATTVTHSVGTIAIGGGRTLTVNSSDITSGTAYGLTTGAVTLSAGGAIFDVANNGVGTGTLTLGTITGAFPITKTGAGDLLTSSTTSGYTAPVEIQAGRVGWGNASGTITESQTFFGAGGLVKSGAGTVNLTGINTFTGGITVVAGTLGFSTINNNGGDASNLGQGNDGITLAGGTLNFIGDTLSQATDRAIATTASSSLGASGTNGAIITFNGPITQATDNQLTFVGTGTGVITGPITQLGVASDFNINGGTWTFNGAVKTTADDVIVTGTTAVLNFDVTGILANNGGTSNGLYSRTGATINLNAHNINGVANANGLDFITIGDSGGPQIATLATNGFDITVPQFNIGGTGTGLEGAVTGAGTVTVTSTAVDWSSGIRLFRGSVAANLAGVASILKQGLGDVTLSGNNSGLTATVAATRLDAGNLILDFSTDNNNKISAAAGLDMRGGALTVNGNATTPTTVTVPSTTLTSGGASRFDVNSNGVAATLNLGAITRGNLANDGTARFELPVLGAITTTSANVNGILGGWATVTDSTGNTYFAANDGSNNIVALPGTAQDNVSLWTTGQHVTDSAGFSGTLDCLTINSLRFDANAASEVTIGANSVLNIASGGILMTAAAATGAHTISGGRLTSGTGEIIVTQDSLAQGLTIASTISGANGLTKAGNGALTLSGFNPYTGATDLQAGTLVLVGGNAIGDTSVVTLSDDRASTLQLMANETVAAISGGNAGSGIAVGTVAIGSNTLTINQTATGITYAGVFTGNGAIIRNGASGLSNTLWTGASGAGFTGSLTINGGLVYLEGLGTMNASSITVNKGGSFMLSNNGTTRSGTRLLDTMPMTLNSADGAWNGETKPSGLVIRTDQDSTTSTTEVIGQLNLASGSSYVRMEQSGGNSSRAIISASNIVRTNGATLDVRGRALGSSSTTGGQSQLKITDGAAEVTFLGASGPLVGGVVYTAGADNIKIVPWAIGENLAAGLGDTNMGNTLVTYIDNRGFTPLDLATEYNTYTASAVVTENIRESMTADLTGLAGKTINALVLHNNNTAASTLNFTGSGAGQTLAVTAGTMLFTANTGAAASAAMNINVGGFDSGITTAGTNPEYIFFVQNPSSVATTAMVTATINSSLISTADITKSGRGTLILSSVNTAGGNTKTTTINEGVLQIGDLDNIGGNTGGLVFAGGTLRLGSGFADDLSTRTITFLQGGGILDTNGNSPVLAGSLGSGSGTFTKVGAGTLTINGTSTLTGNTVISAGSVVLGANQAIGTGDLTVAAGATLDIGAFNVTVGNVTLPNSATNALSGTGTLTGAGTMTVNRGTVSPVLAGTFNLIKQTASQTVVLAAGNSSYSGYTHVQNGTLSIGSMANAGSNSSIGAPTGDNAIIRMGNTTTTGVLQYTGAAASSDRTFNLVGSTGGAIIDNDGTGALTLSGNIHGTEVGSKTLTLQGATTGFNNVFSGSIDQCISVLALTKAEAGTWELMNASNYTGITSINAGVLIAGHDQSLGTGVITFGGGTLGNQDENRTFANDVSLAGNGTLSGTGNFNFNGNISQTGGSRTLFVSNTGTTTLGNASTDTITLAESNQPRNLTFNVASTANVIVNSTLQDGTGTGADGIIKTGAGTMTVNTAGLYTGTTTVDAGTLSFSVDQNLAATTNTLIIGSAAATLTPATLDLSTVNATFGGAMTMNINSSTASVINIGASKTLTINNNVQIGATAPAAANTVTRLNLTGGGTFNVTTAAGGSFVVGGSTSGTNGADTTLDLTGLSATTINTSATGTFRVNNSSGTNVNGSKATLMLPTPVVSDTTPTTTITANNFNVGDSSMFSSNPGQINSVFLGTGLTTINANNINVGTGGRDIGQILFATAGGDLYVRAADGTSRSTAFNVGTGGASTGTTEVSTNNLVDFTGHDADLLIGTLAVGNQARIGNLISEFKFDTGTLDVTNVNIGFRTGTASTTSTLTSSVSIGGGTVILGNAGGTGTGVDIGNSTYAQAGIANTNGSLNISGGNVTIHNSTSLGAAVRLGTNAAAGGGLVSAALNITGGTTTLGGNIIRNATSPRTTSTLLLDGATASLDMGGFSIGSASAPIAFETRQGTLSNLFELNGGGVLLKTGAGTLTMAGTNSYTGGTAIQNGTVIALGGANNRLGTGGVTLGDQGTSGVLQLGTVAGPSNQTVAFIETSGIGTGNAVVGGNAVNSTFTINLAGTSTYGGNLGGAGLNQNNLNLVKSGVGTLVLSGTSTYVGTTVVSGGSVLVDSVAGFPTTGNVSLTVADGAEFSLRGSGLLANQTYGFAGAGNVITVGSGAGAATLGFRLDGAFNTQLLLTSGQTLSIAAGSTLQTAIYVDDAPVAGQQYVLINGTDANSLHAGGGTFNFSPVVFNGGSFTYALSNVTLGGTVDRWVIIPTAQAAAGDVWWKGDLTGIGTGVWSASTTSGTGFPTNWDDTQSGGIDALVPPDSGSIVHFSATGAANFATTLGANLTIQELIFHSGGTGISVDGNSGLYTLTLGNTVDSSGLTMLAGAPNVAITADVALAQAQAFNIADALSTLTFSRSISGTGALSINSNGSSTGTMIMDGPAGLATYSGATNLVAGRLILNGGADNRLPISTNLTLGNATLGSTLQLGDAVNGASNQTIGSLNTGVATTNAIVGGAATASTLTITQGSNGVFNGVIGGAGTNENNLVLIKSGPAELLLNGVNTFTGGTTVTDGVLKLGTAAAITGALTINASAGVTATFDNNSRPTVLTGGITLGGADTTAMPQILDTGGTGSMTLGGNVLFDGTNNPLGGSIAPALNLGTGTRTFTAGDSITAATDLTLLGAITSTAGNVGVNGIGIVLDGAGNGLLSGSVALANGTTDGGSADLTKNGTGTWTIQNSVTISDDYLINAGTLTVSGGGSLMWNATGSTSQDFVADSAAAPVVNFNVVNSIVGNANTNRLFARDNSTINLNVTDALGASIENIILGDDNQGIGNLVLAAGTTNSIALLQLGNNSSGEVGNVTGTGTLNVSTTITLNNGLVSANLNGAAAISKDSLTVTLSGNNSLTGTTLNREGILNLDFAINNADDSKIGTGNLTMGSTTANDATAIINVLSNSSAASLQTVTNLAVAGGPSQINLVSNGGQNATLRITGTLARTAGTLNLGAPTAGTLFEYTGLSTNTNGIVGGWLTINDRDFATISGGQLVAATYTTQNNVALWGVNQNITNSAGFSGTVSALCNTINSLRFDAAAASTITVAGNLHVTSGGILENLSVGANASTITGGTITSGATNGELIITQNNTASTLTIASRIINNAPLTKNGTGALVLSGVNNQTGAINIDEGVLRLTGGSAISDTSTVNIRNVASTGLELMANQTETIGNLNGDGSTSGVVILNTGSTLTLNQTAAGTFSGVISGAGNLVKNGAGILTINGDASMTGAVTVNGGRITLNGATGRLNEATSYTLNGGEMLLVQDQSASQDRLRDTTTITLNNTAGTLGLRLQNTNQNSTRSDNIGPIALGFGHNIITAEGQTGTGTGTATIADLVADTLSRGANRATVLVSGLALGSTAATQKGFIRFDAAGQAAVNGFEVGGGTTTGTTISVIPWMIGDLTLAGLGNTFVTNVDGTTGLRPLASGEYINDSTAITGTLMDNIRYTATAALTSTPTAINSLVFDSGSAIALTGTASSMEITTGSILAAGAGSHSISSISGLTTGGSRDYTVFVTTATGTLTLNTPLTTAVPLVKSGAGTLALTSTSNAITDIYLNQGTVLVDDLDKLGTGSLIFAGGGIRLAAGFTDDLSSKVMNISTGGGTIDASLVTAGLTLTNGIDDSTVSAADTVTLITRSSTTGSVGQITIQGSSSFTGRTVVNHSGINSTTVASVVLNGDTNAAINGDLHIGSLGTVTGTNDVIVQLAANEQIADTASITFNSISGAEAYFKLRGFTETVAGISSASRAVVENHESATDTVPGNGKLIVNSSQDFSFTGYMRDRASGTGGHLAFEKQGTGTQTLVGVNVIYTGPTTISGGTLRLTDTTAFNSAITNDAELELNRTTGTWTLANAIGGTGVLTKIGAGTVVLTGPNTYSGQTHIEQGTLSISASNHLGDGSSTNTIRIANNATLQSTGANVDLGADRSITLAGTGGTLEVTGTNRLTVSSTILGDECHTLNKSGTGALVLSNAANAFTGPTNVLAGTLQVGINGSGQSGAGLITVSSGATLTGTGTIQGSVSLASGATLQAGDVTTVGATPVTTNGTLTFTSTADFTAAAGSTIRLDLTSATNTTVDSTWGGNDYGTPGWVSYVTSFNNQSGDHDRLILNGNVSLATGAEIFVNPVGFTPMLGQIFNLFDWVGITGFVVGNNTRDGSADGGAADDLDLPNISGTGLNWDVSQFQSHGIVAVVPEPSRALLLLLGLGFLALRRRRIE